MCHAFSSDEQNIFLHFIFKDVVHWTVSFLWNTMYIPISSTTVSPTIVYDSKQYIVYWYLMKITDLCYSYSIKLGLLLILNQ